MSLESVSGPCGRRVAGCSIHELRRLQMLGRQRCGVVYVARSACVWLTIADVVCLELSAAQCRSLVRYAGAVFSQDRYVFSLVFVEICNHSHFLKVMTLLNTKTNVAILTENFLAAILDFEYGRHQISIFVNYYVTK